MAVNIIDAPMGFGKTSAMINYMNEHRDKHYVFVTPYLDEGVRVRDACEELHFQIPESEIMSDTGFYTSKMIDFKKFLRQRDNIVTTHALFERFDLDTLQMIIDGKYTLVMDEVADVANKFDIGPYDTKNITTQHTDVDDNGQLVWKESDREYYGRYLDYKQMCDNGCLWYYHTTSIIKMIPVRIFEAFDDIFIMTYMFDAQLHRCYFDLFGIQYDKMYVYGNSPSTYHISNTPRTYEMPGLRDKITIYEDKLNVVGYEWYALSSGWYESSDEKSNIRAIKNASTNYLRHVASAGSSSALWTCFKTKQKPWENHAKEPTPYFTPKSYASSFLACNARATNEYRHKNVLVYPINRFMNPEVKNFFLQKGVEVDESKWALSEMIQWIWRGAIRDGKHIDIYIPSRRMRTLLEQWIAEVSMLQPAA